MIQTSSRKSSKRCENRGVHLPAGVFEMRRTKSAYRLDVPPSDRVNAAEQSDLEIRDFAVEAVDRLGIGIDVCHLKHVSKPALRDTIQMHL